MKNSISIQNDNVDDRLVNFVWFNGICVVGLWFGLHILFGTIWGPACCQRYGGSKCSAHPYYSGTTQPPVSFCTPAVGRSHWDGSLTFSMNTQKIASEITVDCIVSEASGRAQWNSSGKEQTPHWPQSQSVLAVVWRSLDHLLLPAACQSSKQRYQWPFHGRRLAKVSTIMLLIYGSKKLKKLMLSSNLRFQSV